MTGRGLTARLVLLTAVPGLPGMAAASDRVEVYILAGQSNMSGRGDPAALSDTERVADPRLRLYGNDGQWRPALDPLDDPAGQVDAVSADRQASVGPGLFFARALLRARDADIALVPCGKGGSSIARWQPGRDRTTLYGSCVARVVEAGGHPSGLLWYQGESDAEKSISAAPSWASSFRRMADGFRRDLKAPRLPIVMVQLADRPDVNTARFPGWAAIQEQQAQPFGRCTAMVSAKGLARNADGLHLATDAQRVLGPRLAEAMVGLRQKGCK